MPAAGTYGKSTEYAAYASPAELGAVVVKSLSLEPWAGHSGPNLAPLGHGLMLNAVGLGNPGVEAWLRDDLPKLHRAGATVVASIWGFGVEQYQKTAGAIAAAADPAIAAIEVNLSCPNLHDARSIIALDPELTRAVIDAVAGEVAPLPVWAKLSPNAPDIALIARAARDAGAQAVTVVNTLSGLDIDIDTAGPVLANVFGGVSGPLLLPIALRAVRQVRADVPDLAIVGVGGIASGRDAVKMLMAGASAVQVGTANFADPRATHRVLAELAEWCAARGTTPAALTGSFRP